MSAKLQTRNFRRRLPRKSINRFILSANSARLIQICPAYARRITGEY